MTKILVTGGAGFIGSNFIHYYLKFHPEDQVVNLDNLTYAGHAESLKDLEGNLNYQFVKGDITNERDVRKVMVGIDVIVHFAAESHVDRSILDPMQFVKTNVLGTAVLLNATLEAKVKRFHHISTDEVFGQLDQEDSAFNEETPYVPRTPYAASKAGSDHLVRAYFETYGLPITISNCSNNFGPYHDPEKLIPRFITNLLEGNKVPLMGKGENIRDWIYVLDHNRAVDLILQKGKVGETYCIGGEEKSNLEVTNKILEILGMGEEMIEYVEHRLGHDFRYAIDDSKIRALGWSPEKSFDERLSETVKWFKENEWWWKPLKKNRPNVDRSAQKGFEK
ncbi:dTDP-glucose 4,6-dehydratase [Candidatus Daviesbacteria bacterium RIFCSPLOWO2_02_FULL_36_8]|uniref:dTDP-glucose 4,6-dehydratase n=1 Tax=Candidatus Daviesbacteria bacterium RIFCSPLOWO2_02_FULL_36_8 TaxID=1797793 RepID=A0A1F5MGI4_9BACT|nr:MAG: dTDP-glucose 4,6-dehydratase [Candidatus Daviesbacteria bacterium RIFCSPLOWO2_02_FULL_36_8]